MVEGTALWFGASGFEVLSVARTDIEVTISVQTVAAAVGCSGCGVRAIAKDRRWVILRDAPAGTWPWCCGGTSGSGCAATATAT